MAKVTRSEIVEAAVALFNESGYHATSMRDIARAVDIKKPSLYHHFDSKEAILLAILETGMTQLIDDIEVIVNTDDDCRSKMRAAIHAHASLIADNPEGAAVFLREDRGLGDEYMAEYLAKRDHFEQLFRTLVGDCIADGEFREVDITISVNAVLGMVNWMTRWYKPEGRLSAEEIADQFADLFMRGLLKPDRR